MQETEGLEIPPELLAALLSGEAQLADQDGNPISLDQLPPELLQALSVSGITLNDTDIGDVHISDADDVGAVPPEVLDSFVNAISIAPPSQDGSDEDALAKAIAGTSDDSPDKADIHAEDESKEDVKTESKRNAESKNSEIHASDDASEAASADESEDVLNNLGKVDDVIHSIRGDDDDTKHDTAAAKGSKKKTPPVVK